jgi:hypothetical protein
VGSKDSRGIIGHSLFTNTFYYGLYRFAAPLITMDALLCSHFFAECAQLEDEKSSGQFVTKI